MCWPCARVLQASGAWNIDESRFAIETLPPHVYLAATYYQKWFLRNEKLCLARGLVTADELEKGHAQGTGRKLKGQVAADEEIAER